ncbi:ABC transporter substrate-binding protein [Arthrobacter bambusae]|uniref:ABC transport system substrate-binding protein n=1 Tax=Arthrobacter bambusae TaxID=1338426 RepID=A0AAW8DJY0_9MICC|nr:ABC transporter substrate-binding protein [Arthrobacter bambusae]MDP9906040.1 putative ABC transport system substrate-binding protein [Arthrobacter bambusae]MDQ0131165.1 putative ABC transport system substrate-binding protein [Arthrobacter bambusae]MDQ0181843.1 putative ABC transport system substrate-binding protein [Arthrobacter bambusae]
MALTACSNSTPAPDSSNPYSGKTVCIDQYATATAITDIMTGLEGGLADAKAKGLKIVIENPNADPATEQSIAQKFITSGCNVIGGVGTAAAQLQANASNGIPVVFMASSTPVEAGLVASMDAPGGHVTGVADVLNPAPDIDAMLKLDPSIKTIGLIWKTGDPAGDTLAKAAQKHIESLGLKSVTSTITTGADVTQAAQSLVSRVDAIMIPGDTTTISAAGGITAVADAAKVPVFGGTTSAVDAGAVLASGYNYVDVGRESAKLMLGILDGANPASTPVVIPRVGGFAIATDKLATFGLTLPESLKDQLLKK